MNALAHKLHEIAIVLENEASFHDMYKKCAGESYARARTVIATFAHRFAVAPSAVLSAHRLDGSANREHLRRYFDDIYDIKGRTGSPGFLELPPFAFWEDRVKNAEPEKPKAPTVKPTTKPAAKPAAKPAYQAGDFWDTSFKRRDNELRARHGMIWSEVELLKLKLLFVRGCGLEQICVELQRPADGVINKLCSPLQLIYINTISLKYYVTQNGWRACDEYVKQLAKADAAIANGDKDEHVKLLNQPDVVDLKTMSAQINAHISIAQGHIDKVEAELLKARIMSNKAAIIEITTKTLVNGKDIKDFEDSEIYDLIAAQEAEIARLEAIKTKPKKLLTEIAKRQEGIAALVAYLDSKE